MECRLNIETASKEGKSYVKNLYVGKPFRVVSVGQRKNDGKLYEMIMSSSPGVLDGDEYIMDIEVGENSDLQLQSQSYQRLFNMENCATQRIDINIKDKATFAFVPHPVVPHEKSNFKSKAKIQIGDESRLIMSEIITCGRKHHGEVFKMSKFHNIMEVYHQNKLVLKDNVLIQPDLIPIQNIGILEDYTHQGSLIYYSTCKDEDINQLVDSIYELSQGFTEIDSGVSAVDSNGFMVRTLCNGGEVNYNFFLAIQNFLWERNK